MGTCVWAKQRSGSGPSHGYRSRAASLATADDPGTVVNAAAALAFFGEDIGAMVTLVDRALALNPSFARGWHISGMLT